MQVIEKQMFPLNYELFEQTSLFFHQIKDERSQPRYSNLYLKRNYLLYSIYLNSSHTSIGVLKYFIFFEQLKDNVFLAMFSFIYINLRFYYSDFASASVSLFLFFLLLFNVYLEVSIILKVVSRYNSLNLLV